MTDTDISALQARIDDLMWSVDFWTGIAKSRSNAGDTRGNLDAVARMEEFWDKREDLCAELRSLQSNAA